MKHYIVSKKYLFILLVTLPDQPNLISSGICLAPGKKDLNRQKKLGKAFRRSLKGEKGLKCLGFTWLPLQPTGCKSTQVNPRHFSPFLTL